MTSSSFTPQHIAWREGSRAKQQQRRTRILLERMEDRILLTYFPSTANGIHIFEDQLPDNLSPAMTQFVATHTDGTQKELLSQTNQFRAINPNFTVLQYQLGTGNSAYDYIINDQWSSDFNYVNQQESWFAHQTYSGEPQSSSDLTSGRVLGNSNDWYQADIANPAWQQYTLGQVIQNMAANGSNGWFADSFTYGIGGVGYDDPVPTRYQGTNAANPADWPGGVTWTTQLGNWAQTIENAFAQYNSKNDTDYQFIPNLDARATSWEPNWYDNASGVPFIDGAFLEGFGEYTDTYNWTLSMNRGLNLTDNGRIVIMQPYPSAAPSTAAGQQQINFFLGTYLLLKGDQTYLNIDYGGGVQYYPQYGLNLGTATTPLQSNVSGYLWNGVYRRDFQNGFVLVNPGSTTSTLNLGGTYQEVQGTGGGTMTDAQIDADGNYIGGTLSYQNLSSITMAGGTAAIFLDPQSTGSPAIGDPGFEQDVVGAGKFRYDPTGSAWAFSGSSGISGNNSGFTAGNPPAPQGVQVAFIQGAGSFSQNVATWAAGTYVLTFDAAQRGNFGTSKENFNVLIDGSVVSTFTPTGTTYQSYTTAVFTVTAGTHTITFQGLDSAGGDNTAFVDQIAFTSNSSATIGDPGFEQDVVGAGKFQYDPTGSAWAFSGSSGISGDNSGFTAGNPPAPQGVQVAFIQGAGSFSQTVATWAAGTYVLTFDAAQRGNFGTSKENFNVLIDGSVVSTFTPRGTTYQSYTTATFTVAAGPLMIEFQGLNSAGGDNTDFIDTVSIS